MNCPHADDERLKTWNNSRQEPKTTKTINYKRDHKCWNAHIPLTLKRSYLRWEIHIHSQDRSCVRNLGRFFCCGGVVGGGGRGLNSFCQLELFEKRLYCDPMLNVQAAAAPTQICAALEDAAAQAGEAWQSGSWVTFSSIYSSFSSASFFFHFKRNSFRHSGT